MKHMIGTTWSMFLAACLTFGGCSSKPQESHDTSTEYRLTRVQSKAQEDPKDEEEEMEAEMGAEATGGTGTAMALDHGRMGASDAQRNGYQAAKQGQARDQARSAGIVGALRQAEGTSSLTGSEDFGSGMSDQQVYSGLFGSESSGQGTIGAGTYGTIGHGSGAGMGHGRSSAQITGSYAMRNSGNTEAYKDYGRNPLVGTAQDRLSTFAVDVDTASYAIARRKIREGQTPPASSVRVEEFVNYFRYQYPGPGGSTKDRAFAVHMDAAPSPFTYGRHLLRVGVQAKKLSLRERKAANLVFLVDVSGSMSSSDKLPLAKRALRILVDNLRDGDTVSMVTYAGRTDLVLEPTGLEHKAEIFEAIENLDSGGSTDMGSGIELAYQMAARKLRSDAVSRVIVLSDGDANVGDTSHEQILESIRGHVKEGVTLSTVGFGMGNYKDTLMEQLANKGNGNYHYIDGLSQARRVFQEQLGSTLEVVAKDVKIQVDFDPDVVSSYRLIGYENRAVADRDFRNDRVDAGEIGAGHTVTAMYEIKLVEDRNAPPAVVRIRAKTPRGERASEWVYGFDMDTMSATFEGASNDFRFATAVMGAAEILRHSEHAESWRMSEVIDIAEASAGKDADRGEFIELMRGLTPKLARR